jgi:hypothetical protein
VIRYIKAASIDAQIDDVLAGRADVIFHASSAKRFPEMIRRYPIRYVDNRSSPPSSLT